VAYLPTQGSIVLLFVAQPEVEPVWQQHCSVPLTAAIGTVWLVERNLDASSAMWPFLASR